MYVYGEDTSVNPPVPGMREGGGIGFRVNGMTATATPALTWTDDRELHQVNLSATSTPCYDFVAPSSVGVEDIQVLVAHWRQRAGEPGWDGRFDLDGDGDVDIVDIMQVATRWGSTCP